jgi:hypothetical protein
MLNESPYEMRISSPAATPLDVRIHAAGAATSPLSTIVALIQSEQQVWLASAAAVDESDGEYFFGDQKMLSPAA